MFIVKNWEDLQVALNSINDTQNLSLVSFTRDVMEKIDDKTMKSNFNELHFDIVDLDDMTPYQVLQSKLIEKHYKLK